VYGGHFREVRHFRGQNSKNLFPVSIFSLYSTQENRTLGKTNRKEKGSKENTYRARLWFLSNPRAVESPS
jgi:hypothetical protein